MRLVTPQEYGAMHGVGYSTILFHAKVGHIKSAQKVGNRWVLDADEPYIPQRQTHGLAPVANAKKCAVCGKPFDSPPSSHRRTCSSACSIALRKKMANCGEYSRTLAIARAARASKRKYINSKEWEIQSPSGKIYKCVNLKRWFSEHPDLCGGEPEKAYNGFMSMHHDPGIHQWKGWRLISCSNERHDF